MEFSGQKSNSSFRVGLIGAGNWGANLARVLNQTPACDFVACTDIAQERMAAIARQYPRVIGYPSVKELLDAVDAVVIATPISTHYELAAQALAAGKHVFVEKPLTVTSREADLLTATAQERGLTLMTGHTFAYSPAVQKVKQYLDSGYLGDLHYITLQRVNLGPYRADADVTRDLAVHDISVLLHWLGTMPEFGASFGRACVHNGNDDVAFLWLQFPNGIVASIEVSWLSPQKLRRTCIVGSLRTIVYDDTELSDKIKVYDRGMEFREPENFGEFQLSYRMGDMHAPYLNSVEPLLAEIEHFAKCVRTGSRPLTDGVFGANVIRVLEMVAAQRLQRRGLAGMARSGK